MSAHVLGLDLSLSSTGAAAIDDTGRVDSWVKETDPLPCHLGHRPCPDRHGPAVTDVDARLSEIARWCVARMRVTTKLVVIEGPALHAQHGQPHERAGLYWRVVRGCCSHEIPVAVVSPGRMKWFVTGSGRADKRLVRSTVARLYPGRGLDDVEYDRADAVGLAAMGVCWLGWDGPWFDARSLAIATGAQWPDRDTVTA